MRVEMVLLPPGQSGAMTVHVGTKPTPPIEQHACLRCKTGDITQDRDGQRYCVQCGCDRQQEAQ